MNKINKLKGNFNRKSRNSSWLKNSIKFLIAWILASWLNSTDAFSQKNISESLTKKSIKDSEIIIKNNSHKEINDKNISFNQKNNSDTLVSDKYCMNKYLEDVFYSNLKSPLHLWSVEEVYVDIIKFWEENNIPREELANIFINYCQELISWEKYWFIFNEIQEYYPKEDIMEKSKNVFIKYPLLTPEKAFEKEFWKYLDSLNNQKDIMRKVLIWIIVFLWVLGMVSTIWFINRSFGWK